MKERCPLCGQSIMKNRHVFSKALADILILASKRYDEGTPFHLQQDLYLSPNQYNNFQKLKYWGLAEKYYSSGKRKGGYWCLTHRAGLVLSAESIPKWVETFNNKVIQISNGHTYLKDVVGSYEIPKIWALRATPILQGQKEMF